MHNLYCEKYTTNDIDVDINKNVSIIDIVKLFQRVSFAHSNLIGLSHNEMLERDNAFWVITKMKVVLNMPFGTSEKITLKTWTHKPQAVRFLRDLQILEGKNVYAFGRSEWCCLDYKTRKLRKSSSIKYPNLKTKQIQNNNIEFSNLKFELNELTYAYTKTIMPTDIDVNMHTNNIKYSIMALDALTFDDLKKIVKEYEIYFVNESRLEDKIDIYKKYFDNSCYIQGQCGNSTIFRVIVKY